MHHHTEMTVLRAPGTPPFGHAGSGETTAEVRPENRTELNRLLGEATRRVQEMDLRGANELLKRVGNETFALQSTGVKM